jgi:hypothetical protein
MQIEFHQWDWMPSFAAFLDIGGKLEKSSDTKAFRVLNIGSMLGAAATGAT